MDTPIIEIRNRPLCHYLLSIYSLFLQGAEEVLLKSHGSINGKNSDIAFLSSIGSAWDEANQEQRNKLTRCLFQEVWVKDKGVLAVKPQPELLPFFRLSYECHSKDIRSDPEGI